MRSVIGARNAALWLVIASAVATPARADWLDWDMEKPAKAEAPKRNPEEARGFITLETSSRSVKNRNARARVVLITASGERIEASSENTLVIGENIYFRFTFKKEVRNLDIASVEKVVADVGHDSIPGANVEIDYTKNGFKFIKATF